MNVPWPSTVEMEPVMQKRAENRHSHLRAHEQGGRISVILVFEGERG